MTRQIFETLVHPDDVHWVRAALDAALERGEALDAEYRIIRPLDQELRWIHTRGGAIRDATGRAVRFVGIASDITERKRAQEREQLLMREELGRAPGRERVGQDV